MIMNFIKVNISKKARHCKNSFFVINFLARIGKNFNLAKKREIRSDR